MLDLAGRLGAGVAFKDSLMVKPVLKQAAALSRGRVPWAACTKIGRGLDESTLSALHAGGCRTLEVGLETLSEDGQRLIQKRHPHDAFERLLDAAGSRGISLVVNYMTGFPGLDPMEEAEALSGLRELLDGRTGQTLVLEHNEFELERLSPMARSGAAHCLEVTADWPWSSVLDWRPLSANSRFAAAG